MVFKRRNPRPFWLSVYEFLVPKRGWKRAYTYVGHRLRRLPDSPHKIALGVACGVWICFTPLFGLHMAASAALAYILRANILAALLGTFFGIPPTFVIIATINFRLGYWFLGSPAEEQKPKSVLKIFGDAFLDFWHNFKAIFTPDVADWSHLIEFFYSVALPYTVGGLIPGFITAGVFYFSLKPVIYAYQHRRKGRLMARIKEVGRKKRNGADDTG